MPRFLFYVNENPTVKHITGHPEKNGSCGHIFKQLMSGNTQMNPSVSSMENKTCIKIAETENSYWLIIWAEDYNSAKNNSSLQQIANRLGVSIEDCRICS